MGWGHLICPICLIYFLGTACWIFCAETFVSSKSTVAVFPDTDTDFIPGSILMSLTHASQSIVTFVVAIIHKSKDVKVYLYLW